MTGIPRPMRRCNQPLCKQPATHGARCEAHHTQQRQRDTKRLHTTQTRETRRLKYGKGWNQQRQRIIKRDGGCVYCGTTENLEIHHIDNTPTRNLTADTNCITLCRRHHRAIEAETKRNKPGKLTNRINQWMNK